MAHSEHIASVATIYHRVLTAKFNGDVLIPTYKIQHRKHQATLLQAYRFRKREILTNRCFLR